MEGMEDVCWFYANTTRFYVRDLNVCGYWYVHGSLETIICRYQGMTVFVSLLSFPI